MDWIFLALGVAIGAWAAAFLLRESRRGDVQALKADLLEAYEERAQREQERIIRAYEERIRRLEERQRDTVAQARRESTRQSRAVLKGKMAEQIAPLLPGFEYWPSDARFLGDPVDYVVFDGYSAVKDDGASGDVLEIIILDIKRGEAHLSPEQRQIARAVREGRVRFEMVRIDAAGAVTRQAWRPRKRRRRKSSSTD
jgi:predicted Holliday junction resolvase-like endonuclease